MNEDISFPSLTREEYISNQKKAARAAAKKTGKGLLITIIVFTLLSIVLYFIAEANFRTFQLILIIFVAYGFISMVQDFMNWCSR